jgi:hypothetical protein
MNKTGIEWTDYDETHVVPVPNGTTNIFILVSGLLNLISQVTQDHMVPVPDGTSQKYELRIRKVLYILKSNLYNKVNILKYKKYLQSKYYTLFLLNFLLFSLTHILVKISQNIQNYTKVSMVPFGTGTIWSCYVGVFKL